MIEAKGINKILRRNYERYCNKQKPDREEKLPGPSQVLLYTRLAKASKTIANNAVTILTPLNGDRDITSGISLVLICVWKNK